MAKDSLKQKPGIIVIGGSAGSLEAILKICPQLQADFPVPIVIIVHRKNNSDALLVDLLSSRTSLHVKEAEEKEVMKEGYIYIAPGDYHLLIEHDFSFSLDDSEKVNYSRPSIDVTFESAADIYKDQTLCILLSGANADGVNGLKAVHKQKGITIVQDPSTAEVSYMPQQAVRHVKVDHILPPHEIGLLLQKLVQ